MKNRGFEFVKNPENTFGAPLPLRGTRTAAGYDFYAVGDLCIAPQEKVDFSTDVKAYMQPGEMLMLVVRSSAGIRSDLMLANTVGIIDSDFYGNPDNDGNIRLSLRNLRPALRLVGYKNISLGGETLTIPEIDDLRETNTVHIAAGDRVVQGIFVPVLEADNCNSAETRSGGLGSSGR